MPPIEQLRYVRLGTRDVAGACEFAKRILGLQLVSRGEHIAYLRSDFRDHTLVFVAGDPAEQAIGLEIHSEQAFEDTIATLKQAGLAVLLGGSDACAERKVRRMAMFRDGAGNSIELVVRPLNCGQRFHSPRDSGIKGLAGVSMRATALQSCEHLWTQVLGCRVSDWAGDAVFIGIDDAHHRIAYYPSNRSGILAVEYEVESVDLLMQGWYLLQASQVRIVHGPGRRPTSGQLFVTFAGPDGVLFSLVAEGSANGRTQRPRQLAFHAASYCSWGSPCEIPELNQPKASPNA